MVSLCSLSVSVSMYVCARAAPWDSSQILYIGQFVLTSLLYYQVVKNNCLTIN